MSQNSDFIPYGQHLIDEADIASVVSVLRSGALTNGPVTAKFESALSEITGAQEAVACSSGTAALHLAISALGVTSGDCVIVPALTFLASANSVRYVGADVIFADVNESTGLMEPRHFQDALNKASPGSVKAVIAVHMNGQCCDMPGIAEIARSHEISIVEDACHALGGYYPKPDDKLAVGACAYSKASCFSFHPVKTVAMGEGGAITSNDSVFSAAMRKLRNHGMERSSENMKMSEFAVSPEGLANPWYYEMAEIGWNYRASDIHCALGLSQFTRLESSVRRRANLVALYDSALRSLSPIVRPVSRVGGRVAWHLYTVQIDFGRIGQSRASVMNALEKVGIGTQVHYFPVHLQPYYQNLYGRQHLPGAEKYYSFCLTLPLFPAMADADVERIVAELGRIIEMR